MASAAIEITVVGVNGVLRESFTMLVPSQGTKASENVQNVTGANCTVMVPNGTGATTYTNYQVAETLSAILSALNEDTVADLSVVGDLSVGGIFKVDGTPQTLTGAGAVNLTTYSTLLVTTGANALTLAAGAEGQFKFIKMKTDGGDGTLTVTNLQGGTTLTFNDAGDFVHLLYLDAKWNILTNSGCTLA